MAHVNIGMTDEQRQGAATILNQVLSDLSVLYIKTRNYHWNVTGIHFATLHELFEEQYDQLAEAIDEVAERVRMLGAYPLSTMAEFLKTATIQEHPGSYPDAQTMVSNLLKDHEHCVRSLRKAIHTCEEQYDDAGTVDFCTELMQQHEKTSWMLRAHLG